MNNLHSLPTIDAKVLIDKAHSTSILNPDVDTSDIQDALDRRYSQVKALCNVASECEAPIPNNYMWLLESQIEEIRSLENELKRRFSGQHKEAI